MPLAVPALALALFVFGPPTPHAPPPKAASAAPAPGPGPAPAGAPAADDTEITVDQEPVEPPPSAPRPEPEPSSAPVPADAGEVARLQQEARGIRDELFKARARVSAVTAKLFRAKIAVELRSNVERFFDIDGFTITIDGAPVYFKGKGLAPLRTSVVEMFAAPGSHELGVEATLTAKRQRAYRVHIDQTFTLMLPEDSRLSARLLLHEVGNMFARFDKRRRGTWRVHVELRARAKANKRAPKKAAVTATGKASVSP